MSKNFQKLMFAQDRRWADLVTLAMMRKHPGAKRARAFLNGPWSRLFTSWSYGQVNQQEVLDLVHSWLYPQARDAGFPESTFLLPDIELHSRRPQLAVKGDHMDIIGLEDFANRCNFVLNGTVLTAECYLRGADGQTYRFSRETDLGPAIDFVANQLAAWHAAQHGQDPAVSGFRDFVKQATSTVKRVAQNKTVRSLYEQTKPFLRSAVKELPGGETALTLATKAASTYEKAKKGSKKALKAVQTVKAMADKGDPKAKFAVRVMQNASFLLNEKLAGNPNPVLPGVASALQKQRRAGGASYYSLGVTAVSGYEDDYEDDDFEYDDEGMVVGLSFKGIAKKAKWAVPGYAAYRGVKAVANRGKKPTRKPVADHRVVAPGSRPRPKQGGWTARPTPPPGAGPAPSVGPVPTPLAAQAVAPPSATPDLPYDEYEEQQLEQEYYGEDYGEDYGEEYGEEVSGWTYNRPYRTTPAMLVQARKSPGVALSVREVYNRGLGRPFTDLSALATEALKAL